MGETVRTLPLADASPEERREIFMGKSAPDALTLLVAHLPEIQFIKLTSYIHGLKVDPGLQQKDRAPIYVPFDKELAWGLAKETFYPRDVVLTRGFWNEKIPDLKNITPDPESPFKEADIIAQKGENWRNEVYIAFSSRVNDEYGQLLLMDFKLERSQANLQVLRNSIQNDMGLANGLILDSGASYHYWGLQVFDLDYEGLGAFLGLWESYSQTTHVDKSFIETSRKENQSRLRITSGASKPQVPVVVEVI